MVIYSYNYILRQEMEKVFDYFCHKSYLVKYFENNYSQEVTIFSESDDPYLQEGEQFFVRVTEKGERMELAVEDIFIKTFSLISMRLIYHSYEENNPDPDLDNEEDEEKELTSFMDNLFGKGMHYSLTFEQKRDYVLVQEYTTISGVNFFIKGIWKLMGWYYRLRQSSMHKQVKQEIEAL